MAGECARSRGLLALVVREIKWGLVDFRLIEVASGMYIGIYVASVISRVAAGLDVARWHYLLSVLGVAFVVIGVSRAAWFGLVAALVIAVILAPRDKRVLTAVAAASIVVLGAGFSIPAERLDPGGGEVGGNTPTVINEVGASFDSAGESGQRGEDNQVASEVQTETQASNAAWRVAFWRFLIEQSADQPVIGAGVSGTRDFTWRGTLYDSRTGDPNDLYNVTAPHNSFVNLLLPERRFRAAGSGSAGRPRRFRGWCRWPGAPGRDACRIDLAGGHAGADRRSRQFRGRARGSVPRDLLLGGSRPGAPRSAAAFRAGQARGSDLVVRPERVVSARRSSTSRKLSMVR